MKIISGMTVDLIRKREYGGNDEFVGTYKLGMKHPVPFRLIRNNETNEMLFEPILQSNGWVSIKRYRQSLSIRFFIGFF